MTRVTLNSNIYISALVFGGKPMRLLEMAIEGTIRDDLVASHNDLKPENIVFDGDRVWLVDWEAAFLDDRYVDLEALREMRSPRFEEAIRIIVSARRKR